MRFFGKIADGDDFVYVMFFFNQLQKKRRNFQFDLYVYLSAIISRLVGQISIWFTKVYFLHFSILNNKKGFFLSRFCET